MGCITRLALAIIFFTAPWLTTQAQTDTSLKYPLRDRYGDSYSSPNNNPFNMSDSAFLKKDVRYDPKTKSYYIYEKIGSSYFRKPISLTFDEYWALRGKQMEIENFRKRASTSFNLNRKLVQPKLKITDGLFNRIFGGITDSTGKIKIDIKPQGNVDILAGYQGQNTKNPTLPENARKYGTFDFNMDAQFNVNANIGDKLKLPIAYNTLANFDFENQLKLDYVGKEDEIIRLLQAGNISFANKGTLMPGAQALFGLKTGLQFGKVGITMAVANQKSQRQTQAYQGGAATQIFEKKLDDYDENRHFLLSQYFRDNYNRVMSKLPVAQSQVNVLRLEVWVTNRNGATTDSRDVVGFMDLGESTPWNPLIQSLTSSQFPSNGNNSLYSKLNSSDSYRNPANISALLSGGGFKPVQDYEKTYARKLNQTEYSFNQQAGFISLNTTLQSDEVLGIAYQYTYNGRTFQVGEFAQDVPLDTSRGVQKVLFVKLLKSTSQRTNLPLWDLMMKNVYSIETSNLQREGFQVNILYQEPSGGEKRYLPEGDSSGKSLLKLLRLDRLNNNNDPQPDGQFDYVEGYTVQSQNGRIIFPLLEPFGADLEAIAFKSPQAQLLKDKYIYYALYDTIKAIAQQNFAQLDRFIMRGNAKGSNNSEIYLNAFNIPQGSVTITAGGQTLQEGSDYSIDYNLGRVQILNQAILNSGVPVNVNFENNAGFGIQNRGFFGLRLDYNASKELQLGLGMQRLSERPFFTKVNYGEDPIRNRMYGGDFSYKTESKWLTRMLDKLPFYSTKAVSSINAYGEAAVLRPGHPQQIGKGEEGLIYLDDFEGTRANIDLRFPFVGWTLASTPSGAGFANADSINSLEYGFSRSKLSWYQIEPVLQDPRNPNNPSQDRTKLSDPRVRAVDNSELFPQKSIIPGQNQLLTFDMLYSPKQRGPYNYNDRVTDVNAAGDMLGPNKRWGGLMRSIDQTDFESGNVEFIEFWLQDPYIKNAQFPNGYTDSRGGDLVFNLGNISEDILKDGRRFYENGLPSPTQPTLGVDSSVWGKTPINPIQLTQAFSNDQGDRPYQDVGFDGLRDEEEVQRRDSTLNNLKNRFGANSPVYLNTLKDPSNDNFVNYRGDALDASGATILQRYKNYNNPQGNSPVNTGGNQVTASTLYPDNEDLNRDNTLNENEEYFEYRIDMRPQAFVVGQNYISDKRSVSIKYENGSTGSETWYQFRIPIRGYNRKVGNIPDFKSIRFMRMYLTNWQDSVNLRFAKLDLVRNQWRNFYNELTNDGTYVTIPTSTPTTLNTLAVNLEENSGRTPIPYKIPPGIERVQSLANGGVNILSNEQALSMQIRSLQSGYSRGVFKTINFDLRQYKKLSMFIHAEEFAKTDPFWTPLIDDSVYAVIRLGQDFISNYYEIKIPLKITRPTSPTSGILADSIWPVHNNLDFSLDDLVALKNARNNSGAAVVSYFSQVIHGRQFAMFGSPNLGEVKSMLVSVQNPRRLDGPTIGIEVWINELRLSKLNEDPSWAAIGRVDLQLADLGSVSLSMSHRSVGWGSIEQRVNERSKEAVTQFDLSANMEVSKLLPKQLGLTIPMYASISSLTKTPQFDPFDKDIKYKDKIATAGSAAKRDSIRNVAIEKESTTTVNFTNVRFQPKQGKKNYPWSKENFDVTYSYIKQDRQSPTVESDKIERHRGVLGYNYTTQPKYIEPFKKIFSKNKTHWFDLIKDFNLNLAPSLVSVKMDVNRQFGRFIPRDITTYDKVKVDTTYDKYFVFDRAYAYRWDITKSFNFDYQGINKSRIDELPGAIDTKQKKEYIRNNFWRGGRNTSYDQKVIFTYTLPLAKFPLTDWINARVSYNAGYRWIASSLLAQELNQGNFLENDLDKNLNAEFDFNRLYQKSRWLRALDETPAPKQATPKNGSTAAPAIKKDGKAAKAIKDSTSKTGKAALAKLSKKEQKLARKQAREQRRLERQNRQVELSAPVRILGRIVTMVKRASVNYGEVYHSRLPGYLDSTQYFGNNWKSRSPGLGYILGKQPDTSFLNDFGKRGLLTHDTAFNLLFTQSFDQKLSIQAQLEPFKEFIIDLNLDKTYTKNYTELFKDTSNVDQVGLTHLSPYATGGFSVSFIAFNTLFEKYNPNELSETFKRFEANRLVISQRLYNLNPYKAGPDPGNGKYKPGYGRYSQEVLIPAFIAAYTKQDPGVVSLIDNSNAKINANPFRGIKPKPNWRVNFTGLTKIEALQKTFSAISITHAYQSKLSMNSFTSALTFQDPFGRGFPSFVDTLSNNYVPYFLVPNLTIQESFEPLLGIDITTTNQISARFEYKKSRQLSLSLIDYQLAEIRSTELSFGASWRKRGFPLPFKLPKFLNKDGGKKLENDINFKLDFSVRDDVTTNNRLDQGSAIPTSGQKVIKISPSIDYVLNNRINIRLYFDQQHVKPYISSSAETINTRAGAQIRISLAQ
ncbi:MAG: cell surface protein SprA [Chitinophagaceae bacterium]